MAGWCIFSPSMLWRPAWGCTRDCNDSLVILQTAVIQLLFPAISVPVPVLLGEGFISMHVASAKLIAGAKISTQCSHIEQILSLDCWTSNYKEMWSQAKILCLWSVKSHWMLNAPLPRKQNLIYQVPLSCVRSIFVCVFYSISYSSSSVNFLSEFKLLLYSIQHEWHLDHKCVPISRSNIWKTLLCVFQLTHAFHFRVLALPHSLASKLQVDRE